MEKIEGYAEHIIYRNEENGYTVFELVMTQSPEAGRSADGREAAGKEPDGAEKRSREKGSREKGKKVTAEPETITCVGSLPAVSEGEILCLDGEYTLHPSYGKQFKVASFEIKPPTDEMAIERYLGSGAIKGMRAALAGRIVRRFGADTFRIIEQEPERLAEIKGISEKKAREIAEQVAEKKNVREAFVFLSGYGISNTLAMKIYRQYGERLYSVIRDNPYQLADDIDGVGFKISDEIARRAGISVDSDFRIRSGVLYVLSQAAAEGHLYLPFALLQQRARLLLGTPVENLQMYLTDLAVEHKVAVRTEDDETKVYAATLYYMEVNTARMLWDLDMQREVDEAACLRRIASIEKETGTQLDERQRLAVLEAARSGVLVLTGGPGTGKTTTINTMIAYFLAEGLDIALAAPTGRAAKRMTEATGYEAKTIHRLLEVEGGPESSGAVFGKDRSSPLEYDVVIVDEMSMVDIFLMHALLSAVSPGTRLIMVGDASQLPSVGPGCVLRDIIESDAIKVVRLERIFRQARMSDIVVNAHRINQGEHPALDNKSRDFFFLRRPDAGSIIAETINLVADKLPGYVKTTSSQIQVLTPTRKGLLGVEQLNATLQQRLNPPSRSKAQCTIGDRIFRVGDKVMQIKNNYQLEWEITGRYGFVAERGTGIYNGDIGTVLEIDVPGQTILVEFDDHRRVTYQFSQLDDVEHAYAVTIHKSQGSEYPAVIIPLLGGPKMLLNRNLLYTAVTRARSCVVLIGDPAVFHEMIDNTSQLTRYTSLKRRLQEAAAGDGMF